MQHVLVINSGSSSFKYQLFQMPDALSIASGIVERIGMPGSTLTHKNHIGEVQTYTQQVDDHTEGFELMMQAFEKSNANLLDMDLLTIGHRVVQGGKQYSQPTLIDKKVYDEIDRLSFLAPLHNPANLQGISAATRLFPKIKQVAVFDTAFHSSIPSYNYTYAIDRKIAEEQGIRKYGFHGTSFSYVSKAVANFLHTDNEKLKQIILHVGNGASICAVSGGKSIATSMGFSPLSGLAMGTRSGDIDPAVVFQLYRRANMSIDDIDALLNKQSGLLGLTGSSDLRDVEKSIKNSVPNAINALDIYLGIIRKYIGAYLAELAGADAIVFTAGAGENSGILREKIIKDFAWLGFKLDSKSNNDKSNKPRIISTPDSSVKIIVMPTDEEKEIAKQSFDLVSSLG